MRIIGVLELSPYRELTIEEIENAVRLSFPVICLHGGGALELTAITSARLHLVDIDLIRPSVLAQDRVRSGLVKLGRRV